MWGPPVARAGPSGWKSASLPRSSSTLDFGGARRATHFGVPASHEAANGSQARSYHRAPRPSPSCLSQTSSTSPAPVDHRCRTKLDPRRRLRRDGVVTTAALGRGVRPTGSRDPGCRLQGSLRAEGQPLSHGERPSSRWSIAAPGDRLARAPTARHTIVRLWPLLPLAGCHCFL